MIHRRMLDSRSLEFGGRAVTGYRPMTMVQLASRLADTADDKLRWKLVWEFLEEYRWEPPEAQPSLLADEPSPLGDDRWDALLAALAEYWVSSSDLAPLIGADFGPGVRLVSC